MRLEQSKSAAGNKCIKSKKVRGYKVWILPIGFHRTPRRGVCDFADTPELETKDIYSSHPVVRWHTKQMQADKTRVSHHNNFLRWSIWGRQGIWSTQKVQNVNSLWRRIPRSIWDWGSETEAWINSERHHWRTQETTQSETGQMPDGKSDAACMSTTLEDVCGELYVPLIGIGPQIKNQDSLSPFGLDQRSTGLSPLLEWGLCDTSHEITVILQC